MISNLPSKEDRLFAYRAWIERICLNHSVTPTDIARSIGASPSTITRQLKPGWTDEPQLDIVLRISFKFFTPLPTEFSGFKTSASNVIVNGNPNDEESKMRPKPPKQSAQIGSALIIEEIGKRFKLIEKRLQKLETSKQT